jgi:hypothetical protein
MINVKMRYTLPRNSDFEKFTGSSLMESEEEKDYIYPPLLTVSAAKWFTN